MSDYRTWQVGDRVCCIKSQEQIDFAITKLPGAVRAPASQQVCTIREIRDDHPWLPNGQHKIVLLLEECDNRHLIGTTWNDGCYCYVEPGFNIEAFRKIHPRSTSKGMSILTDILKGVRVPEGEDA